MSKAKCIYCEKSPCQCVCVHNKKPSTCKECKKEGWGDPYAELKATKEIPTLVVGIWIKPQAVLNYLKIKVRLQQEDWQGIKQLPIGELGYDYEEGLRIYAPFEKSLDVYKFVEKMIKDLKVPKKAITVEAVLRSNGYRSSDELTKKALKQGWKLYPMFQGDNSTLGIK